MFQKIGHLIDEETGVKLVELIVAYFQKIKTVTEEGLMAYSGLCTGIGSKVNVKLMG